MPDLYAWATPAFMPGSPVDHTWVTSYDNQAQNLPNIQAVTAAHVDYWYCWGSFHAQGGVPGNATGSLGHQSANLGVARCLVQPNADSGTVPAARGTIFVYGVDGVCHQLANQVLFATGGTTAPLTVRGARGYFASCFLYGTYGLQHTAWAHKIQNCHTQAPAAIGGLVRMAGLPDDFEDHARNVLGDEDPELLGRLLALKGEVHAFAAQTIPGSSPPSAALLNMRNQHLLDQAANLLGAERFKRVFGFAPGETINLVDPTQKNE